MIPSSWKIYLSTGRVRMDSLVDSMMGWRLGTRSSRRSEVAKTEMTGDAENHEITEWQAVVWIY